MPTNMQPAERQWESSPCMNMNMHEPASPASLVSPGAPKPMTLETECNGSPVLSRTQPPSNDAPRSRPPRPSQSPSPPPAGAEIYHVDLHEWYPHHQACLQHFLDTSQHAPRVQALFAYLNLRLPCQRPVDPILRFSPHLGTTITLRPYLRRLIVTANDTPQILGALFGAQWTDGAGAIWQQERLNYLFTAKSEGWEATKAAYDGGVDEQVPFLRPLREPREEELRRAEAQWSEWLAMEDWMVGPRSPW